MLRYQFIFLGSPVFLYIHVTPLEIGWGARQLSSSPDHEAHFPFSTDDVQICLSLTKCIQIEFFPGMNIRTELTALNPLNSKGISILVVTSQC